MRSLRVSMIGVYRIDTAGVESAEIKTAQRRLTDMACVKAEGVRKFVGVAWVHAGLQQN
jgi:hypothetical protein